MMPKNLKVILSSLSLAVVLFLSIFLGLRSGQLRAESTAVLKTAESLTSGLNFFYKDQNRFPTATEFSDNSVMVNYFSAFPPQDFISNNCQQSFAYKWVDKDNYQLSFCLATGANSYNAGWNTINGKN